MRKKCEVHIYEIIGENRYSYIVSKEAFVTEANEKLDLVFNLEGESGGYSYVGIQNGQGHWFLKSSEDNVEDQATLHRMPNSSFYEGQFYAKSEDVNRRGFWVVKLLK
jgi:hypothetical protein